MTSPAVAENINSALKALNKEHDDCYPPGRERYSVEVIDMRGMLVEIWPEYSINVLERALHSGGRDNIVTVSDVIRAVIVYVHGGVYFDSDMLPRHIIRKPTIGYDQVENYKCDNRFVNGFHPQRGYFPPGVNIGCMCNCFFAFTKGHKLLEAYIHAIPLRLKIDGAWGSIGPTLFYDIIYALSNSDVMDEVRGVDNTVGLCLGDKPLEQCMAAHCFTFGSTEGELCSKAQEMFDGALRLCTAL